MYASSGPDVSDELISALVRSFASLRTLVEEGTLSYPYSTRELVGIVRHLQQYPADGLVSSACSLYAPSHAENLVFD